MNSKSLVRIFVAIVAILFVASSVSFAGDATGNDSTNVGIDLNNRVENNNRADANAEAIARQKQQQAQTVNTPRQFIQAPGYPGFVNPGTGIMAEGWVLYAPAIYRTLTMEQINRMERKFRISDLLPWNWGASVFVTLQGESLAANEDPVGFTTYWPRATMNQGDLILATIRVKGEPDYTEETYFGTAAKACKTAVGSRRVATRARVRKDGVTIGASVGFGGAESKVASEATAVAFAAGGQFGTNRTRVEDWFEFEAICLNDGPLDLIGAPEPPPAKVVEPSVPPTVPPVEDPRCKIEIRIHELEQEVELCKRYCFNNLQLRLELGRQYIELYIVTGEKKHLSAAIYSFGVAERNFKNGHDISAHQAEASEAIAQVYYYWAGCKSVLEGRDSAAKFASSRHLERFPAGFAR